MAIANWLAMLRPHTLLATPHTPEDNVRVFTPDNLNEIR